MASEPSTDSAAEPESATSLDNDTPFSRAIEEHLSLKKRNAGLDGSMPIDQYEVADPMENHPLFKSEEQARLEETLETIPEQSPIEVAATEPVPIPALPWPGQGEAEGPALDEGLWGKSRDFDWGE